MSSDPAQNSTGTAALGTEAGKVADALAGIVRDDQAPSDDRVRAASAILDRCPGGRP